MKKSKFSRISKDETAFQEFVNTVVDFMNSTPLGDKVTVEEIDTDGAVVNSVIVAKNDGKTAEWKTIEAALKVGEGDQGKILQNITTGLAWTGVKTINQQSILGDGNIDIQGGGGTQLYKHELFIRANNSANEWEPTIITTSPTSMVNGFTAYDKTFISGKYEDETVINIDFQTGSTVTIISAKLDGTLEVRTGTLDSVSDTVTEL